MERKSIDGNRIFSINGFLSPAECEQHVQRSEEIGYETFTVGGEVVHGFRNNARLILDDPELADILWQRAADQFPPMDSMVASALNPKFRYYRYTGDEAFAPHHDGSVRIGDLTSKLTFLIYLSDVAQGGETRFYGKDMKVEYSVKPKLGSALVFDHFVVHEGVAVEDGTKYVLRSDVMYG